MNNSIWGLLPIPRIDAFISWECMLPKGSWKKIREHFRNDSAIGDVFNALTSPRIYRNRPFGLDRASAVMVEGGGKDFAPNLLKIFVGTLGLYPIGTLIWLDTGEMGLVMDFA
jgi:hypothetical protein